MRISYFGTNYKYTDNLGHEVFRKKIIDGGSIYKRGHLVLSTKKLDLILFLIYQICVILNFH